jgi:hypothetical protein
LAGAGRGDDWNLVGRAKVGRRFFEPLPDEEIDLPASCHFCPAARRSGRGVTPALPAQQ